MAIENANKETSQNANTNASVNVYDKNSAQCMRGSGLQLHNQKTAMGAYTEEHVS